MFRPGLMRPQAGQQNVPKLMRVIGWLYPVIKRLAPSMACTLKEMGQAMINSADFGYAKPVLEVRDIVALAKSVKS